MLQLLLVVQCGVSSQLSCKVINWLSFLLPSIWLCSPSFALIFLLNGYGKGVVCLLYSLNFIIVLTLTKFVFKTQR